MLGLFKNGGAGGRMDSSTYFHLRKYVTPEIIFGNGARHLAGKYAAQFAAGKVLLVSDRAVSATAWFKDVCASLNDADVAYVTFTDVSPNPRVAEVRAGVDVYRAHQCDVIVAIGGGSPMDCAKAIGIVCSNENDILDYVGVDRISQPVPPLIFIPSTAGSSADVSQFCIVLDPAEAQKVAIVSKAIVPDVALIDPEVTLSADPYLTACSGVDALTHAVEAFVSTGRGVMTDSTALEAIQLIYENLPKLLQHPDNIELRSKVMLGSMKAGLAFSNASLGAVHAMAHSLGGVLDLAHGECNAMLLDHVIAYNYAAAPERFALIAQTMGIPVRGETPEAVKCVLLSELQTFKQRVGIIRQLQDKGVHSCDLARLSGKAMQDACMLTNPRKASQRDIEVVFAEAM